MRVFVFPFPVCLEQDSSENQGGSRFAPRSVGPGINYSVQVIIPATITKELPISPDCPKDRQYDNIGRLEFEQVTM